MDSLQRSEWTWPAGSALRVRCSHPHPILPCCLPALRTHTHLVPSRDHTLAAPFYKLCVCRARYETGGSGQLEYVTNGNPGPQIILSNFAPETNVTVAVRAANSIGWGAWSANAAFTTGAPQPPSRPLPARRAALLPLFSNVTTIAIQWSPPDSIGAPITSYKIWIDGELHGTVGNSPTYYQVTNLQVCMPVRTLGPHPILVRLRTP